MATDMRSVLTDAVQKYADQGFRVLNPQGAAVTVDQVVTALLNLVNAYIATQKEIGHWARFFNAWHQGSLADCQICQARSSITPPRG